MGNHYHYHRLTSLIAATLTFLITAIASPEIASAQTRIISLSGDLDFGQIPLGSSAQRTLTISNAGDSVLTISNLDYPPEPVSVSVDLEGNWSGPLAPGESHDVVITFTPLGTAFIGPHDLDFAGYLYVESDANAGTSSIAMSGIGTWPPASRILSLASNLDFGSVPLGTIKGLPLSLTNSGSLPLTISNITFPDGFSSFSTPCTIDPGTATNIYVLFSPTTVTNYGGIATVNSDSTQPILVVVTYGGNFTNSLLGINQFAVSGTGAYPSGKFIGLFMPTNNPAFNNSGYFTANCTPKGKLNATLTLAGKRYPFSAQISPSGYASATIVRKHLANLNVSLQFGAVFFSRDWTGTIGDGTWTADLKAEPAPLVTERSARFIPPGKYTINISGSTNSSVAPTAQGTGTINIRISDATHVTGILGDGTRYSQNTILCGADVPFYAPLYRDRGAIIGWITFNRVPPPRPGINPAPSSLMAYQIVGTLNWFKPAGIDPDYPDGFSFQTAVTGSVP